MRKDFEPHADQFEAPFDSAVTSAGAPRGKKEQKRAVAKLEYQHYSDLLHSFIQKMERWDEAMNVPEYSLGFDGTEHGYLNSPYRTRRGSMITIVRSEKSTRILPKWGHEGRQPEERATTLVTSGMSVDTSGIYTTFGVGIFHPSGDPEPLLDPYDNTSLSSLTIDANSYGIEACGYSLDVRKGGYSVSYGFDKESKSFSVKPFNSTDELLSDDHVKALFDLVDSLIPQASPQLPTSPTAGEQ